MAPTLEQMIESLEAQLVGTRKLLAELRAARVKPEDKPEEQTTKSNEVTP